MNIWEHNSTAWDKYSEAGIEWSVPVGSDEIERARGGDWSVILTPLKTVPREWFGDVRGKDVLCLASGGGQQAPILAAAGARVVSFDASARQLEKDRFVAERDGLEIRAERGDAADLSRFADASFDLIFHPVSNCFIENVEKVWRECFRILRSGGALLAGFNNPVVYVFDTEAEEKERILKPRFKLPYADAADLTDEEKRSKIERGEAFEFSHSLDTQIGGQIAAGFLIAGFYEDWWTDEARLLNQYMPTFLATRAIKP